MIARSGPKLNIAGNAVLAVFNRQGSRLALAAAGGVLAMLGLPPFYIWPATLLSLAPMVVMIAGQSPAGAARRGFACGFFINLGIFYWLIPTVHRFAELPWLVAVPIALLLCAWQAIPFAAVGWLVATVGRAYVSLPIGLIAVEHLWPTVFPWHLGFGLAGMPLLVQSADLIGYSTASLLVAVTGVGLVAMFRKGSRRRAALGLGLLWAGVIVYGTVSMNAVDRARLSAERLRVAVVQPNFSPSQREAPKGEQRHDRLARLLQATGRVLETNTDVDVLLWPESSYPYLISRDRTADFTDRRSMGAWRVPLLLSARTGEPGNGNMIANSIIQRNPDGRLVARYDKIHLMPFGESLPFYRALRSLWDAIPNVTQMLRGEDIVLFDVAGARLGPMICVEDMIPSHGRALAAAGADILVNFTNDVWFGTSVAAYHHLTNSVFRSIELRRDMVRATLTGVSAHIDAAGRVLVEGPLHDLGEAAVPETFVFDAARLGGITAAASLGDAVPWGSVVVAIVWGGFTALHRRRSAPAENGRR